MDNMVRGGRRAGIKPAEDFEGRERKTGVFEDKGVNIGTSSENKFWFTMKKSQRALLMGVFIGLLIGGGIIFNLVVFELSNYSSSSAVGIISIFLGVVLIALNWGLINPPAKTTKKRRR